MSLIESVTVPEGSAGLWTVERFTIGDPRSDLGAMQIAFDGRYCQPGTYTRLIHMHRGVVMSDTMAERDDHHSFVRNATGHCLINGLGIGMCLAAILRKDSVTKVTVVEVDKDIIDLVSPHYSDPRVNIVHCSAFDYQPPKGERYGAVWHDIWDSICEDNLPEMERLHRKYGRRADWQGSWGKEIILHQRRRTKDAWWRP